MEEYRSVVATSREEEANRLRIKNNDADMVAIGRYRCIR